MANSVAQNPFVIDTAGAGKVYTGPIRINKIRWTSTAALAGHTAVVQDGNGKVIYEGFATGANYVDEAYFDDSLSLYRDIIVPTLTSGKVYIYFG